MRQYLALKIGGTPMVTTADMPHIPEHLIDPPPDLGATVIRGALTIFLTAGVIAALITVIWAGIQWSSSGSDKQKVAQAKGRLTWGIIGLIIMMLSFFIINIWGGLFGVNLLNINL
jgi:hypothetical protein